MSIFLTGLFFIAMIGLPLFIVLSMLALAGFLSEDLNLSIYFAELIRLAENPTLVAIPLFTVAGYILAKSKASDRLVRFAQALIGWLPGGLAVVALSTMALFTAFSGASGITIVAMGGLLLPALLKSGFRENFSLGLLTVSGSVGLLFPPSLPLIIYAVIAETPVDKMFIAGIVPGILMVSGLSLYSIKHGFKLQTEKLKHREPVLPAIREAIWELPLPVVVIGGIYSGFFTATEAAIATVFYLIIVECFIIRDIHPLRDLPGILRESSILIGGILLILGSALALTNYLVFVDVPSTMVDWIKSFVTTRIGFLLMLNIFLLIIGCLMDVFSALVVVVPLILPVALEFGIDPVHLGIIFLANLDIGYSTPPVGLNLFISSFRFKRPVLQVYRSTIPFLAIQIIILILITYIPVLTLYPLGLMGK